MAVSPTAFVRLGAHSQVISSGVNPSTRRDSKVSWNSSRSWPGEDDGPLVRNLYWEQGSRRRSAVGEGDRVKIKGQ
jgi:hypothetical protein